MTNEQNKQQEDPNKQKMAPAAPVHEAAPAEKTAPKQEQAAR